MEKKYQKIKQIVEKELACSAHNMEHVIRVYHLCMHLAKGEKKVDLDVLVTAALLHDIARVREDTDSSRTTDHAVLGAEMAEKILKELSYPKQKIDHVKHCIVTHRLRTSQKPKTKEAEILSDADKLDAIGAIGLCRIFVLSGQYGRRIYSNASVKQYVRKNLIGGTTKGRVKDMSKHAANLEYEVKLKHLGNSLHTKKAKEIAKGRLEFMAEFFARLRKEMEGKM
jgi:uncharacterized protein